MRGAARDDVPYELDRVGGGTDARLIRAYVERMTTVASVPGTRLRAALERLDRPGRDARGYLRAVAAELRRHIPADRLMLLRTDPTTLLPLDGLTEAMPPGLCGPFWDNELLDADVNRFADLARDGTAATLVAATGGEPGRSRRFTVTYAGLGVGDELRVAFTARDRSCWGIGQLLRTGAVFDPAERDALAAAAPAVADALRVRSGLGEPAAAPGDGPVLVIVDAAGRVRSGSAGAREWLEELAYGSATGMRPVPEPVYAVAARARAAADAPAYAQVRTARRGWLHLHASRLEGPDAADGAVAVVLSPAQAPGLMPLLALVYHLTPREQDVLHYLAQGLGTAEITRHLGISAYTVRDHIKALFGKVGVRSRPELLARVFTRHYADRLDAAVDRPYDQAATARARP